MATTYETRTEQATYYSAEVKRPGRCAVCGREIEARRLWDACLYVTSESGTLVPVHKACAGVRDKSRVGGGRKVVRAPEIRVQVRVPVLHDAW
jgi:hypothetical protein